MGMQGNLRTMVLPDVLQWLTNANGTGILHVRAPNGISKRIFFGNGAILSTASSDPREYLGQFLISRGYITEEQLNMAMETQMQTNIKLGKVLMMVGILEEQDLKTILVLKAEESLYDLFLWDDGDFNFEDKPNVEDDLVPISLDVMSLIMEGIRRKDEWGRIRRIFKSSRVVISKTDFRLKTDSLKVSSLILRTYEAIDGQKTIEDLALHLHATEFEVTTILYKFYEKGIVVATEEKPPADQANFLIFSSKLLEEAEKALAEDRFADALNLFRYALKAKPDEPRVIEGLRRAEEGYIQQFFSEVVPLNSKVELAIPIEKLMQADLTPQEGYLASRFSGDWDLESVVKVSPLPRLEALKAIRKMFEKGLIRIRASR